MITVSTRALLATSLTLIAGGLLQSCGGSRPAALQFVITDPFRGTKTRVTDSASTDFGPTTLDDSLCYAVHVTADDLMVARDSPSDTCATDTSPHGVGQIAGMFSYGSTNTFKMSVKSGSARRFDLLGLRKTVRTDIVDHEEQSPTAAPNDCPPNLTVKTFVEEKDGQTKIKVRLYSGTTPINPQILFLASGTTDLKPGINTVTLTLRHNPDGSLGTSYGGDCNNNTSPSNPPDPPTSLHYPVAAARYIKGVSSPMLNPMSSGGLVTSYSINPTLPSGLFFSTTSGIIGGAPTSNSSQQAFTITATNSFGSTTTTLSLAVITAKRIFVTDQAYNGDLNGVAGADARCNLPSESANPHDGSNYKALLVTHSTTGGRIACTTPNCSTGNSEHYDWVIAPYEHYVRSDVLKTDIGNSNAVGLFTLPSSTLPLVNSFDVNPSLSYWTGFNYDSKDWTTALTLGSDDNTCHDWTISWQNFNGKAGAAGGLNYEAFSFTQDWCDTAGRRLLCVEQ
ncbi:MAG: DUF1554 domain-containing protein [Bdellovibrionota bacterium]